MGLAITDSNTVVVACYSTHQIREYSSAGSLLRTITLTVDIDQPRSVVQLPWGQFGVVQCGSSQHRYCVVGSNGVAIKCYGGAAGSAIGQFNCPNDVAVDARGTTYIADYFNSRIIVIDPFTFTLTQLHISGGINASPMYIHYDKLLGRLYIGENSNNRRVLAIAKWQGMQQLANYMWLAVAKAIGTARWLFFLP